MSEKRGDGEREKEWKEKLVAKEEREERRLGGGEWKERGV